MDVWFCARSCLRNFIYDVRFGCDFGRWSKRFLVIFIHLFAYFNLYSFILLFIVIERTLLSFVEDSACIAKLSLKTLMRLDSSSIVFHFS